MLSELREAKRYLGARFGYGERIPNGDYAVPTNTSKGNAYMKVVVSSDGSISGFNLFWDQEMEYDWNGPKPESTFESAFSKSFRILMDCPVI